MESLLTGILVIMILMLIVYIYIIYRVLSVFNKWSKDFRVGVICESMEDFQSWRVKNMLIPQTNGSDFLNKSNFKVGNTTYIGLVQSTDLCSHAFNTIRETSTATNNEHYDQIKSMVKEQMRQI